MPRGGPRFCEIGAGGGDLEAQQTRGRVRVVAIDGPSGAGKSSVAMRVARALDLPYLDTGAMYRAVGLTALRRGYSVPLPVSFDGVNVARETLDQLRMELGDAGIRVRLGNEDVSDEIRSAECSEMASAISELSKVRALLVEEQRRIGEISGGVMEGRDIGTVVFPDALLKVFLTASAEERALRRLKQRNGEARLEEIEEIVAEQERRDHRDSTRSDSPLRQAEDAVLVDSTDLTLDEVVHLIVGLFQEVLTGFSGRSS